MRLWQGDVASHSPVPSSLKSTPMSGLGSCGSVKKLLWDLQNPTNGGNIEDEATPREFLK